MRSPKQSVARLSLKPVAEFRNSRLVLSALIDIPKALGSRWVELWVEEKEWRQ